MTNKDERQVLSQIFELDSSSSVDTLKLDFHYINYNFCKQYHFSNEKTSTMLAMFHSVLQKVLVQQLTAQ